MRSPTFTVAAMSATGSVTVSAAVVSLTGSTRRDGGKRSGVRRAKEEGEDSADTGDSAVTDDSAVTGDSAVTDDSTVTDDSADTGGQAGLS